MFMAKLMKDSRWFWDNFQKISNQQQIQLQQIFSW